MNVLLKHMTYRTHGLRSRGIRLIQFLSRASSGRQDRNGDPRYISSIDSDSERARVGFGSTDFPRSSLGLS